MFLVSSALHVYSIFCFNVSKGKGSTSKIVKKRLPAVVSDTLLKTMRGVIVPDPGKGVCADPVNGVAILEGGGDRIPKAGTRSVS